MTGDVTTQVDRSYLTADTRTAAGRYLIRTGNADMLVVLGLAYDPDTIRRPGIAPGGTCPICGNRIPAHGVCRRRGQCREAAGGAR